MPRNRGRAALGAAALSLTLLVAPASAATCTGPPECCPPALSQELSRPVKVALGVALVGIYNVNERSSTWDADYYLYEVWPPLPGFTPQTEVVNEVVRVGEQFESLTFLGGQCIRSRRLRSTVHTPLNLRLFPFDSQALRLQFSDSWFEADHVTYQDRAVVQGIDRGVREQLSQWRVSPEVAYGHRVQSFGWEKGLFQDSTPAYDNAEFSVQVKRHVAYHLTKYFLPLLLILALALSVFWVDPEDLASQVGIGITCLLTAIAFQLTQAVALPEVSYLILADLVYVVCYVAIALAMVESLYCNSLFRQGRWEHAKRVDARCRVGFPVAIVVAVALSVVVTTVQSSDAPLADEEVASQPPPDTAGAQPSPTGSQPPGVVPAPQPIPAPSATRRAPARAR